MIQHDNNCDGPFIGAQSVDDVRNELARVQDAVEQLRRPMGQVAELAQAVQHVQVRVRAVQFASPCC